MRVWRIAAAAVLVLQVMAQAQQPAPIQRAPDGGTWERIDGIFLTPIPDVPFSAIVLGEATRVMEDGGTLTRHWYTEVARDTRGRVRLERRALQPANVTTEPVLLGIILIDMQAGSRTECMVPQRMCRVLSVRKGAHAPILPAGPIGRNEFLERLDLGHAQKAGFDAVGTRETITVQPQTVGNDRVMVSSKEIWYSPYLQINLSTVRRAPKTGTDVLTVGEINLGEPAKALLEVPPGYRMVDERAPAAGSAP